VIGLLLNKYTLLALAVGSILFGVYIAIQEYNGAIAAAEFERAEKEKAAQIAEGNAQALDTLKQAFERQNTVLANSKKEQQKIEDKYHATRKQWSITRRQLESMGDECVNKPLPAGLFKSEGSTSEGS